LLFNSLIFLVFLPIVFTTFWIIKPQWRNSFLLIASYYFYFSYNPWFLLLLIGTSSIDYYIARFISKASDINIRKRWLVSSLCLNIGTLFIFKYFIFFYNSSLSLFSNDYQVLEQIIIPAGLSFYTFQSLSYIIDVYRGKYQAEDTLHDFLLYVSFFPHMVAGPVVRYYSLMPQLKVIHYFKSIDWENVAKFMIWGYFKKIVIADNLSQIVTPIFADIESFSGATLLLAGFLFVVQVYADFSGYSDIATGVAKLFDIELSLNWRRPLFSTSLHMFWKRNHISITTWFRDYLYIGLGGNRVPYKRWLLNIFLVFVISGLWHGSNFTFLIWGALHGIFFVFEILAKKQFPRIKIPRFIGWMYLLLIHTLFLIAFRALNISDLFEIYSRIFSSLQFDQIFVELKQITNLFFGTICFSLIILLFIKEANEEFGFLNKLTIFNPILKPIFYIWILIFMFLLGNFDANQFIYFQF
jgi:alginate O-acetyltransferase complex protein AlgI